MAPVYEYKGYQYLPWEDREPDNIKIFHDVKTPTGETIHFDMSPYTNPTEETFKMWVDLGCPKRTKFNFSNEDIQKMYKEHEYRQALFNFVNEGKNEKNS